MVEKMLQTGSDRGICFYKIREFVDDENDALLFRNSRNAKIYVNSDKISADELQGLDNIVPVTFTDGAYCNFPDSQIIISGVRLIKTKGHANGNSIIVENNGLFSRDQTSERTRSVV